ncbi:MAG: hypothetical protein L0271_20440 [Gemmatimonadetes bacterium]|nr:hypothetical protein [Gemmatimonadota bacterium]
MSRASRSTRPSVWRRPALVAEAHEVIALACERAEDAGNAADILEASALERRALDGIRERSGEALQQAMNGLNRLLARIPRGSRST